MIRCGIMWISGDAHGELLPTLTSVMANLALVLATPPPLELLLVQGRPVVRHDGMVDVDEERLAVDVRAASETLLRKAVGS